MVFRQHLTTENKLWCKDGQGNSPALIKMETPSFLHLPMVNCPHVPTTCEWQRTPAGDRPRTHPHPTAASVACFWSPQRSGLIWFPPNFAERVLPNFLAHLEDPAALPWEDQVKTLRVSRACVTPPQPSTFYTGLNFSSLCRNSALCTRILPESYILRTNFSFIFLLLPQRGE